LVDSYRRFRDALQCCGEMNPRAFSTEHLRGSTHRSSAAVLLAA
jgi:hypothetical protein